MADAMPRFYYLDVEDREGVVVARVTVDSIRTIKQAEEFSRELAAVAGPGGAAKLVLDLGNLQYLISSGYAALIGLGKSMTQKRGRLALCNFHPDVLVGANVIGLRADRADPRRRGRRRGELRARLAAPGLTGPFGLQSGSSRPRASSLPRGVRP